MTRIDGVLLDLHQTLLRHDPTGWIEAAWSRLGRPAEPLTAWGAETLTSRTDGLRGVWRLARLRDPGATWDLTPAAHREAFTTVTTQDLGLDRELAESLYALIPERWEVFEDTVPMLTALRERGVAVAVVSNTGMDPRAALDRMGVLPLLDAVTLSFEVGAVKPDPAIFRHALDGLGVDPGRALMVGDTWDQDGGGAALGIRTLILPPTDDRVRGLAAVTALVDLSHRPGG